MASGVNIKDDCKEAFKDIKLGRKHAYVVFALTKDCTAIEVCTKSKPDSSYDELVEELRAAEKDGECRYAIYDAEYTKNDQKLQKLIFLSWSPDTAKIKQKMVYASSKDAFKKSMGTGLAKEIQANDDSDLLWDNILENILKSDRH